MVSFLPSSLFGIIIEKGGCWTFIGLQSTIKVLLTARPASPVSPAPLPPHSPASESRWQKLSLRHSAPEDMTSRRKCASMTPCCSETSFSLGAIFFKRLIWIAAERICLSKSVVIYLKKKKILVMCQRRGAACKMRITFKIVVNQPAS